MGTTLQKIVSSSQDRFDLAKKYYGLLFVANNIDVTKREIELATFIGINGNIFSIEKKQEFCSLVNTTMPTVANTISKLYKLNIIVKGEGVIDIQPSIKLDFDNDIRLEISLEHGK